MVQRRMNIVIVDDEESVRALIVEVLVYLNASITEFGDGLTAWEHIKSSRTDIVISDVHMDGMKGLELLTVVKGRYPHRKCIIISGDPSMESPAFRLGADAFLRKPFDVNALRVAVNQCVESGSGRAGIKNT